MAQQAKADEVIESLNNLSGFNARAQEFTDDSIEVIPVNDNQTIGSYEFNKLREYGYSLEFTTTSGYADYAVVFGK